MNSNQLAETSQEDTVRKVAGVTLSSTPAFDLNVDVNKDARTQKRE